MVTFTSVPKRKRIGRNNAGPPRPVAMRLGAYVSPGVEVHDPNKIREQGSPAPAPDPATLTAGHIRATVEETDRDPFYGLPEFDLSDGPGGEISDDVLDGLDDLFMFDLPTVPAVPAAAAVFMDFTAFGVASAMATEAEDVTAHRAKRSKKPHQRESRVWDTR